MLAQKIQIHIIKRNSLTYIFLKKISLWFILLLKLYIFKYCKLPSKQKTKNTEKTVLFIKKPVAASL